MENRDKSRRRLRLSKMLTIACVLVCAAGVGVGDATPSYIKGFVDMYRMVGPLSKLPPLTIGGLTDEEKQSLDGGLKFVSELSNLASDHLIVGSHNASEVAHHGLQSALHFAEKTIVEGAKLAERGLEILDEIEKKAPHYAGTVRNVVPLVGGRSVADVKTDVLALPGRFVPTLNNVVGKSHYLVEQVRSFFEKFVNVTNDIIQIILAMIRLAVTGELGEVEKYEKDLMQRTTGTSSAPGSIMDQASTYAQLLSTAVSNYVASNSTAQPGEREQVPDGSIWSVLSIPLRVIMALVGVPKTIVTTIVPGLG